MAVDPLYETRDFSSFSNFEEIELKNTKLEWDLNFETQILSGLVEHEAIVKVTGTESIIFDTSSISISGDIYINGSITEFTLAEKNEVLGSKLTVTIPEALRSEGSVLKVLIFYTASPTASAIQWLSPDATKGKKHPYVFTQSQAIHARSLLPCMDAPGVKTSYTAIVTAPEWCTVLMSALQDTAENAVPVQSPIEKPKPSSPAHSTFYWNQPVPTSAYLIALAAGNMASRDVSPRVRIWAEPEVVEAAHYEFAETEEFLKAAEDITGCPYQWGRYDVVCLPPSFPYGGMENPCLTFATPTLLAGDRSLADVIAHEIAHSWTGNLVTNAIWNHFWLNEGWTVWLERKITSKFKNNVEVGRLSAQIGYQHLKESVSDFKGEDQRFTQMVWPLQGEDPDHAFSSVPYEKGFNLLNYLETIIGTEHFEAFAKAYIDKFKFKTATTGAFRDFFVEFVTELVNSLNNPVAEEEVTPASSGKKNKKKNKNGNRSSAAHTLQPSKSFVSQNIQLLKRVEELDWNALFLTPGMPTYPIDFSNSLATTAHELAHKWISSRHSHALNDDVHFHSARHDMDNWSSQQKCLFLEDLLEASTEEPFSVSFLTNLNHAFGFQSSNNSEIMLRWQQLCIRANVPWIYDSAVNFLTSQGRMKFVRPILRALRSSQIGGKKIEEIFEANKNSYHPIARKMLGEDLVRIDKEEVEAAQKAAQLQATKSFHRTPSHPGSPAGTNGKSLNGISAAVSSAPVTPAKTSTTVDEDDDADFQDARPMEVELPTSPAKEVSFAAPVTATAPATPAAPVAASVVTPAKEVTPAPTPVATPAKKEPETPVVATSAPATPAAAVPATPAATPAAAPVTPAAPATTPAPATPVVSAPATPATVNTLKATDGEVDEPTTTPAKATPVKSAPATPAASSSTAATVSQSGSTAVPVSAPAAVPARSDNDSSDKTKKEEDSTLSFFSWPVGAAVAVAAVVAIYVLRSRK